MTNRVTVRTAAILATVAAFAALAVLTRAGGAQPTPSRSTSTLSPPAACSKAVNDWQTAHLAPALAAYRTATAANRAEQQQTYKRLAEASIPERRQKAQRCAAKFDVATIPATQLPDLVSLLNIANDTTGVRRTTDRLLSDPSLPLRTRAQALLLGMNQEIARDDHFAILPGAEQFVAKIDQLPDSLNNVKLTAHRTMLGRYEYLDVADGLFTHATALIALARARHDVPAMTMGYTSLARSYADRLHPDSALRILDSGEQEIGASAISEFKDFRTRYHLIGTTAPKVVAKWWINTAEPSVVTPMEGNVTLIEFTAHWCGPCKNSYPGLRALAERFRGKAFTGVMVTQLYGYLGAQTNLTPAQEIEADKAYFGSEHTLPFPVAINPQIAQTGGAFVQPKPDTDYRVGGIPQIMLIDKHGVIRQIVTGWDQGNTARFAKLIEQLLAER